MPVDDIREETRYVKCNSHLRTKWAVSMACSPFSFAGDIRRPVPGAMEKTLAFIAGFRHTFSVHMWKEPNDRR
jgi:hypothetical protein